ncbi:uncharacterized protein F5891DRAFT_985117 [Suillus fuscotomentosus]|uniref:Uncharacterized protein n=1 Tax=Suillus fuscotomentosus TaxID=1912939 RepID=A0AAD4DV01_9AGAM|nr:uncharacterized protein F5891DRAFT_985117 [Suillus fuscotomentosus]KAG1894370.1 hypothetical protein F5891DRAFT_985117 [Suillus fuscotomentosus]
MPSNEGQAPGPENRGFSTGPGSSTNQLLYPDCPTTYGLSVKRFRTDEEEKAAKISDITHKKHLAMGATSKANKAHLRNIQSALSRSHKTTIEDVSDSEEESDSSCSDSEDDIGFSVEEGENKSSFEHRILLSKEKDRGQKIPGGQSITPETQLGPYDIMLWKGKGLQKQIRLLSAAGLKRSQKWWVSKSKTLLWNLHLIMSEKDERIQKMLEDIRNGQPPCDDSPETFTDSVLNAMDYKDFPALRRAHAKIAVSSKDKKLDVVFRSRITAMLGALNLYLDPELSYGWHEAFLVASKSLGQDLDSSVSP